TDDVRFRLHLPNDLADLFLWQLGLGEAVLVELAFQRSFNHRGLVGTKKVGHVIRGRLGGKTHDRLRAFARRAREPRAARDALPFKHEVRPSAFAVLRWMTSSYLVGACTGRWAGFSPRRMRWT